MNRLATAQCRRTRSGWLAAILIGTFFSASACHAPPDTQVPPARTNDEGPERLSLFSTWSLDRFLDLNVLLGSDAGYVALFARDGEIIHAKAAGYADIDSETPMQIDTRFRIASMTKPITAVAALILIEEDRLDLDDPVSLYIPAADHLRVATASKLDENGDLPTEPLSRPLTVRDLLTFNAGIGAEDRALGRQLLLLLVELSKFGIAHHRCLLRRRLPLLISRNDSDGSRPHRERPRGKRVS